MTDSTITQRTEVMLVTPALATSWLKQNVKFQRNNPKANRNIRPWWVNTLAGRLTRGEWLLMPHGVVFAPSGRLLDGQHRLLAIEQANLPALMNVHWDFAEATFKAQDSGIPRSLADRAEMPRNLAQVIRLALVVCYNGHYDVTSAVNAQRMARTGLELAHDAVTADTPNTAIYAAAPVRLMASSLVIGGSDVGYVHTLYQNLTRRRFNDLPPIANVFASQAEGGGKVWTSSDKPGLMARVRKVFDPIRRDEPRLSVNAKDRQDAEDYIKTVLKPRYERLLAEEERP